MPKKRPKNLETPVAILFNIAFSFVAPALESTDRHWYSAKVLRLE